MAIIQQLPYECETATRVVVNAEPWCVEHWGPRWSATSNRSGTWCVFWRGKARALVPGYYRWHFATEQQRTAFLLKWA